MCRIELTLNRNICKVLKQYALDCRYINELGVYFGALYIVHIYSYLKKKCKPDNTTEWEKGNFDVSESFTKQGKKLHGYQESEI